MTWSGVLGAIGGTVAFIAVYWFAFAHTDWTSNTINATDSQALLFTLVVWFFPAVLAAGMVVSAAVELDLKLYRRRRRAELAAREAALDEAPHVEPSPEVRTEQQFNRATGGSLFDL
ncbi:hypothetical protein [Nocardioides aquaticus]|nr:hypothetical protein [Nocardioides aquaticus]